MSDGRLDAMSRASHLLSEQYSPARWADTLLDSFAASVQHQPSVVSARNPAPSFKPD